jgi:prepilin-type N-terminal cleavage/methylation domain-containing protein
MDNFCKIRRKGFTLVELLIAMAVGIVIIAAVYSAMNLALRFSANTDRKVITQQDTRAVLDLMAMEIRMASYNPLVTTNTWSSASPLACMPSLAVAPIIYKGIKSATANSIAVAMDIGGGPGGSPSGIIGDANNEYIVYSYDGANTITRNVNCGGNQAILGGTAPDSNVRNAIAGIALFRYYDRLNQEILVTSLPARIPDIRSIQITIVTDTLANDTTQTGTPRPRRMIYSTSVIVRNHAISP